MKLNKTKIGYIYIYTHFSKMLYQIMFSATSKTKTLQQVLFKSNEVNVILR